MHNNQSPIMDTATQHNLALHWKGRRGFTHGEPIVRHSPDSSCTMVPVPELAVKPTLKDADAAPQSSS